MNAREWGRGDTRRLATRDFPPAVLALVDEAQGGRYCVACRQACRAPRSGARLCLDHKQPLSRGGDNHWSNLRWLCEDCNRGRGNRRDPPPTPRHLRGLS